MIRARLCFAAAAMVAIALGLATRMEPARFPDWIATYGGDALWASTASLIAGILLPDMPTAWRSAGAFTFAVAIECSQLYHSPWIDSIRATTPGSLVLGSGFLWSDIACYAAGVGLVAIAESAARRASR
jgi:hypothetical protein